MRAELFIVVFAAGLLVGLLLFEAVHETDPLIFHDGGEAITRDGVALVMLCGEYRYRGNAIIKDRPDQTAVALLDSHAGAERGDWTKRDRGDCDVYYHHDLPLNPTEKGNDP